MNTKTTIVLLLLLATTSTLLHAQAVDTIQPNPKAVLLKRIWMIRGSTTGEERVGEGAGSLKNINDDQYQDFAVGYGAPPGYWNAFLGDSVVPTVPVWHIDSTSAEIKYPIVGNFWGDTSLAVGFFRYRVIPNPDRLVLESTVPLFRVHDHRIDDTATVVFNPAKTIIPGLEYLPADIRAADLDNDGDDELIVAVRYMLIDSVISQTAVIWIFSGGPNFQVDSPTLVLKDIEESSDLNIAIADFNDDRYPDILLTAAYDPPRWIGQCKFFWGKPSLQQLSQHPDHAITLNDAAIGVGTLPAILDLDGDSIADIAGSKLPFSPLFLSSSGKPISQRTFRLDDADQLLFTPNFHPEFNLGPLNDSTHQHSMLPLFGPSPLGGAMMIAFGTSNGRVDPNYDAYYGSAADGMAPFSVFGKGGPAGDVNGDGWSDYLAASPSWSGNDAGIAMILAGGPYIPRDDNTTSVRDIPAEGRSQALSVWPNPVGDELNIAWRGDLPRMPQRFTIHDPLGRLVASGTVQPSIGAARWECGHVAAGQYLLTAYDRHGEVIATTTIIKQE